MADLALAAAVAPPPVAGSVVVELTGLVGVVAGLVVFVAGAAGFVVAAGVVESVVGVAVGVVVAGASSLTGVIAVVGSGIGLFCTLATNSSIPVVLPS